MDNNIPGILDQLERLAYKILLWSILLPKTIVKVLFSPEWVSEYVKEQLKLDPKVAFDKYVSPVVLFLAVTLIPAILINFTPTVGLTLQAPIIEDDLRTV